MKKTPKKKKPAKPYRDFPLFLHRTGQWAKKIKGKMFYFGKDADAAFKKYTKDRDDLYAGRTPRDRSGELLIRDIANRFLDAKKSLLNTGELSPRTWGHYYTCCEILCNEFGKTRSVLDLTSKDFEKLRGSLAKTRGAHALAGEVQRIRTIFKFAWDEGLIEKPVRFGTVFKKPSKKIMRQARHDAGPRMIEAEELRILLNGTLKPGEEGPELPKAGHAMRAMILLAINCGFGQTDVATLKLKSLDLAGGWVEHPRPKTAIMRRCPLWPETIEAIREAIRKRPKHKSEDDAGIVFITKYGYRWVRVNDQGDGKPAVAIDSVRLEFEKLLVGCKMKRRGLGFYAIRHAFRTAADSAKDQPAIDHIMGHSPDDMASLYRERIDDERLKAVSDHVRKWVFGKLKFTTEVVPRNTI